ncbi:MAG: hypothetical protein ACRDSK_13605 [Actinophytocola sp.]|uniref:hypothetical protein n=1 Tax=Actinophytocola sp. TaxID=1872138 RepID=UPI003D6B8C93
MPAPVVVENTLTPSTVNPGGSSQWTTRATDSDARSATLQRPVTDSQGNTTVFSSTLTVSDPLTYGQPTCDDPGVALVVDAVDPTIVHVTVA